eukprot:scaffold4990_cov176-Amphora_coffeaeformis.AAC.5
MLSGSQSSRVVWGAFRFFATRQNAEKDFFRSFTTVPVSIQHIFGLHALCIVADFVESIKEFMWAIKESAVQPCCDVSSDLSTMM